mmetsp:Transcript_2992/g.6906  ORF Transcript_2992/g.6906 Transcript_2992/m.6906 type:complete len:483 (-) Transcript_2992:1438-2886(-)
MTKFLLTLSRLTRQDSLTTLEGKGVRRGDGSLDVHEEVTLLVVKLNGGLVLRVATRAVALEGQVEGLVLGKSTVLHNALDRVGEGSLAEGAANPDEHGLESNVVDERVVGLVVRSELTSALGRRNEGALGDKLRLVARDDLLKTLEGRAVEEGLAVVRVATGSRISLERGGLGSSSSRGLSLSGENDHGTVSRNKLAASEGLQGGLNHNAAGSTLGRLESDLTVDITVNGDTLEELSILNSPEGVSRELTQAGLSKAAHSNGHGEHTATLDDVVLKKRVGCSADLAVDHNGLTANLLGGSGPVANKDLSRGGAEDNASHSIGTTLTGDDLNTHRLELLLELGGNHATIPGAEANRLHGHTVRELKTHLVEGLVSHGVVRLTNVAVETSKRAEEDEVLKVGHVNGTKEVLETSHLGAEDSIKLIGALLLNEAVTKDTRSVDDTSYTGAKLSLSLANSLGDISSRVHITRGVDCLATESLNVSN